ncbi:MAG: hypothetical protein NVS4B10_24710 [Myxococcales bacterium]
MQPLVVGPRRQGAKRAGGERGDQRPQPGQAADALRAVPAQVAATAEADLAVARGGRLLGAEDSRVGLAEGVRLVGEQHELGRALLDLPQRDARVAGVALADVAGDRRVAAPQVGRQRVAPEAVGKHVAGARQRERVGDEGLARDGHQRIHPDRHEGGERRRAGAGGLTLVNTLMGLALDPATGRPRLGAGGGGLSGEG